MKNARSAFGVIVVDVLDRRGEGEGEGGGVYGQEIFNRKSWLPRKHQ